MRAQRGLDAARRAEGSDRPSGVAAVEGMAALMPPSADLDASGSGPAKRHVARLWFRAFASLVLARPNVVVARRSGRRARSAVFSLALISLAFVAIAAPYAHAETTRPSTGVSFGPDGVGGSERFGFVGSMIRDPGSGIVLVADPIAGRIYKFDSAGKPLEFVATGTNYIEAPPGLGFATGQIAIAPVGSPAGTAGDIYVPSEALGELVIYSPAGKQIGTIESSGTNICGAATDAAGHLFVTYAFPDRIGEYVPTTNPPTAADFTNVTTARLRESCNVAINGAGKIYFANDYGESVYVLKGLGDQNPSLIEPGGPGLAIDPGNEDLYLAHETQVRQLSAGGTVKDVFGVGRLKSSLSVAVDGSNVLVGNNGETRKVEIYGPAAVLPTVKTAAPTAVQAKRTTLNGIVNPSGLAVSSCKFEYGLTEEELTKSAPCGALPPDEQDHNVSATVTELEPETTYYFRLEASNSNGENLTTTSSFTTTRAASTGEATNLTVNSASLNGTVYPEGQAVTGCVFEYGENELTQTVPCEQAVPTDTLGHHVSAKVSGLEPGSFYGFRLTITQASGTIEGQVGGFATLPGVTTGPPASVTLPTAQVRGTVNPAGQTVTNCQVEYGPTPSYEKTAPCDQALPKDEQNHAVTATLNELSVGATYHYRFSATYASGPKFGEDETFTTPGPIIESSQTTSVLGEEATLTSRVNPNGRPTTYHFEIGLNESYGLTTAEQPLGSGNVTLVASTQIMNLVPSTEYHWRVVATNESGTAVGPDQTFRTIAVEPVSATCANEQFRIGASSRLPDCRAYELVSPIDKGGQDIEPSVDLALEPNVADEAALSGDRFTFSTSQSFGEPEGAPYDSQYLSERTASGWVTDAISTKQNTAVIETRGRPTFEYLTFTPDLCHGVLQNYSRAPLSAGALPNYGNLYERDLCSAGLPVTGLTPEPREPAEGVYGGTGGAPPVIGGVTPDGRCAVYFPEDGNRNTTVLEGVRENCSGVVRQVAEEPDGTVPALAYVGYGAGFDPARSGNFTNALSNDGSIVYWGTSNENGALWVRVNSDSATSPRDGSGNCVRSDLACTLPVSKLVPESYNATFLTAASDGSLAYFSVFSNATGQYELYVYSLATRSVELIARGPTAPSVLGASSDGDRVYFSSSADLAGGGVEGQVNIYLYDRQAPENGRLKFVATGNVAPRQSSSNGSGTSLVFESEAQLTGYVNRDRNTGEPVTEVYLYSEGSEGVLCVSCNPSGARPLGFRRTVKREPANYLVAGALPERQSSYINARTVTEDGTQAYFESSEPLIQADSNGVEDVYEWSLAGTHSCRAGAVGFSAASDGCVTLISTGQAPTASHLVDSSPDGSNVFFLTSESLVPQDPGLVDIYDARVGGGFALEPQPAGGCEGEACQGPYAPPQTTTPSSATYHGPGNAHKRKKQKRKQHKKHRKHHAKSRSPGKKKSSPDKNNHGSHPSKGGQR